MLRTTGDVKKWAVKPPPHETRRAIGSECGELLAQLEETGVGGVVAAEGVTGWLGKTVLLRDR